MSTLEWAGPARAARSSWYGVATRTVSRNSRVAAALETALAAAARSSPSSVPAETARWYEAALECATPISSRSPRSVPSRSAIALIDARYGRVWNTLGVPPVAAVIAPTCRAAQSSPASVLPEPVGERSNRCPSRSPQTRWC